MMGAKGSMQLSSGLRQSIALGYEVDYLVTSDMVGGVGGAGVVDAGEK